MVWPIFKDLKQLWTFHHVTNIILCVSYYLTRVVPPFCYWLYPDSKCIIGQREYEIFSVSGGRDLREKSKSSFVPALFIDRLLVHEIGQRLHVLLG